MAPLTQEKVDVARRRRLRLDSLRGIAALGVFAAHSFGSANGYDLTQLFDTYRDRLLSGGGFGIYVLFALSGYLLFLPFAKRHFASGPPIALGTYARNRVLRLYPLYVVMVAVILIVQEGGGTVRLWLIFLTLSESFFSDTLVQINGVVWTLIVEAHFYLLLPLLAVVVGRASGGSTGRGLLALAALGAASFALRYVTFIADTTPDPFLRYSFPSNFIFFVPGMMLAVLRLRWEQSRPHLLEGLAGSSALWFGSAAALFFLMHLDHGISIDFMGAVLPFLIIGGIVLPLRSGPLDRVLDWRPFAAIGIVSYGFYLWQVPLLDVLDEVEFLLSSFPLLFLVGAAVCFGVSFVTYYGIEAPFKDMRGRWGSTA